MLDKRSTKGGEDVSDDGIVCTTKKSSVLRTSKRRPSLFDVKRVTPSLAAPGDTNLSDATQSDLNRASLMLM